LNDPAEADCPVQNGRGEARDQFDRVRLYSGVGVEHCRLTVPARYREKIKSMFRRFPEMFAETIGDGLGQFAGSSQATMGSRDSTTPANAGADLIGVLSINSRV
jgi:hypothetical protein